MMQVLSAGGLPILTDGERAADEDNPRGYYEWNPIKLLARNPKLIAEAEGKTVKVISQLLFALPLSYKYQVVLMRRPLAEVAASQAEMIRRRGQQGTGLSLAQMTAALDLHLNQVRAWLKDKSNISVQCVDYGELLKDPQQVCQILIQFFAHDLDIEAMV